VLWDVGVALARAGVALDSHPARFSDAARQTCLLLKTLLDPPLRQGTGLVACLLKLANPDMTLPGFSTLCWRQEDLLVTIPP
jgi:hypothetical protein